MKEFLKFAFLFAQKKKDRNFILNLWRLQFRWSNPPFYNIEVKNVHTHNISNNKCEKNIGENAFMRLFLFCLGRFKWLVYMPIYSMDMKLMGNCEQLSCVLYRRGKIKVCIWDSAVCNITLPGRRGIIFSNVQDIGKRVDWVSPARS